MRKTWMKGPPCFGGIEIPRVNYKKLSSDRLGVPSAAIHARVQAARQHQRFAGTNIICNAVGTAQCARGRSAQILSYAGNGIIAKLDETGDNLVRAAKSCCA